MVNVIRIRVHTPGIIRALRRPRYVVITLEGARFIEKWYLSEHIPFHLTRLYQFLLGLIWMRGTMTTDQAQRLGYNAKLVQLASSNGYVKIHNTPQRPSIAIQNKIIVMIGEAPRRIYA